MSKHLKICSSFRRKLQMQAGEHSPAVDLFDEWIGASTRDRPVTSRDGVKERVLRIIISGNLPFSFAENIELLELFEGCLARSSTSESKGDCRIIEIKSDSFQARDESQACCA